MYCSLQIYDSRPNILTLVLNVSGKSLSGSFQNGSYFKSYSLVCLQISPFCPILKSKNQNNYMYLTLNEATKPNLHTFKRIFNGGHFGMTCTYILTD